MNAESPKDQSTSLSIATAEWGVDIDKKQITNDPKIWEEMSHLAWPTNSLIPMLLEARKFREEERIEEAREVIERIKNTQMIRKIIFERGWGCGRRKMVGSRCYGCDG